VEIYNYEEKGHTSEVILSNEKETINLSQGMLQSAILHYKARLIMLSGKILDYEKETLKLNRWARETSELKTHLKNLHLKIVKNDCVVREIKMNNMYVLDYTEEYNSLTYTVVLLQHNRRSEYTCVPIDSRYGGGRLLIQPKDDSTRKILDNIRLGLNGAGGLAVTKTGIDGLRWLWTEGLLEFSAARSVSFLARFNLYYLATHGVNLIISTSADIYFKSIGYEEGVGKVNPLRDIYKELGKIAGVTVSKMFDEYKYNEELWEERGENLYYALDLTGAATGLFKTTKEIIHTVKYGEKVAYKIYYSKGFVRGIRKLRKSYMLISSGAVARDVNPVVKDAMELMD